MENGKNNFSSPSRKLTAQEEAAILARFKAELDPGAVEAECKEVLEQWQRGELIPFEEVLRELGIDVNEPIKEEAE